MTLGLSGPQSFSVSLDVAHTSGLSRYLIGRVGNLVVFRFRVRQEGSPPVAVGSVPLTVRMRGAATTEGDALAAYAGSGFEFSFENGNPWTAIRARGTNDSHNPPRSASFDETFSQGLAPGTVIICLLGTEVRSAVKSLYQAGISQ